MPPNPGATAQQNPAQPAQNADAPQSPAASNGTSDNAIVVTGLRRALQSARNIKRNSPQVVDAVVAEDIGKLPDITVSDTAARIPGVSVERSRGEAGRVLLRGFDNTYYTTTYNSREIFTAETRSVALQDFPSGAIAAVEAFKTSTANLVEPGIAGLVNVRSRRPFDFKGLEVDASAWALFPRQSRDVTPNGNILLSDRWAAGDEGEFGALVNFSFTEMHFRDSIRRYHFNIVALAGGRAGGDWPQLQYNEGDRKRPSINGALQWRPHPGLEFYAEGLWQGYRDNWTDRELDFPLWGGDPANFSNIVLDSQGHVVSGTVKNPGTCCGVYDPVTGRLSPNGDVNSFPDGFQGATKRKTDTYQFAVGGSWDSGPLRVSADLARTSSTFQLFTESVDFLIPTHNYTVNWYNGEPGGYGPTFNISGIDFSNPANYNYRGFYEARQRPHGDDWQGRLDFEYTPRGIDFLSKIQWGVRYVDRNASDQFGDRYAFAGGTAIPISAVPLTYVLYPSGFRGDDHAPTPITWLGPTFDSVWSNMLQLRQFDVAHGIAADTNDPAINPTSRFNINEKSYAAYGQLNFKLGEGETFADGILGMRVVRTKEDIAGFSVTAPSNVVTPVDYKNAYTDWLPNANVNVHFGRDWLLRLAVTKTRTRPTFQQLNPRLGLADTTGGTCNPTVTQCLLTGSGGNPFLKPLRSWNYDASLEYYFSNTGFASVGAFHRDMRGFIVNQLLNYPGTTANGYTIQVSAPVNTDKATINGLEAQVRTFFDFAGAPTWIRSFGIEANATYIKAKADTQFAGGTYSIPIPDVSPWTFNVVGMYEHGPLSVRLAYNWRTPYGEGAINPGGLQGHARPSPRLDLSASYNWHDNVTFFVDWTNILNHPFKDDVERWVLTNGQVTRAEIFPMMIRYEEEIVSAGVRFHFGREAHRAPPPPPMAPPPPPPPPPATQTCADGSVIAATATCPAPPPPPPPPAPAPERG